MRQRLEVDSFTNKLEDILEVGWRYLQENGIRGEFSAKEWSASTSKVERSLDGPALYMFLIPR